ncbi:MAG TPA: lipid-A-disaccharide synthase [Myxococcaceae bacterium]|nr:lipid-A-disaccharide synthase [Myxococcaceae bacterium]
MASGEILVVAGEASGDLLAAEVLGAMRARRPDLRAFGMGGPRLAGAGLERLFDAAELSVMGFTEVLPRLPRIWRVFRGLLAAARSRRPEAAVLVDIPDFNLRLARRLHAGGIPVAFYVSPTVWAWRPGRARAIARDVDRMLCILPFEEDFYRPYRVRAVYVGNPVAARLPAPAEPAVFRQALALDPGRPTLAVVPGSRPGELRRCLPPLADAAAELARRHPGLQIAVPVAPGVDRAAVDAAFRVRGLEAALVPGRVAEVVGAADVAVVTSGTAALEAGLMLRPLVVVYRVSWLSWLLARALVRVSFVSLVNLLAGRRVVPELLQAALTPANVVAEVTRVWNEGQERRAMVEGLRGVRELLGRPDASARAAEEVLALIAERAVLRGAGPPR